jgi:hypothetical protein
MLAVIVLAMVMFGCGLMNTRYGNYNPSCQVITTTSVGSPMLEAEEYCKNDVYGTNSNSLSS